MRELVWLADGRQKAEWALAAGLTEMVNGVFAGRDPLAVIPTRYRPMRTGPAGRKLTPEQQTVETKVMLSALTHALTGMNRQAGK